MSDPIRLTSDALQSLLGGLDHDSFVAFVADLYARSGRETDRRGSVVTAVDGGGSKRILVWTDERGPAARLTGSIPATPDVDDVDVVLTRTRDDAARMVAEETGAALLDVSDLHDRLLYGVDREACRDLCREYFDREVDPDPGDGDDADYRVRPGRVVAVIAILCGLLVVGLIAGPTSVGPNGDREAAPVAGTVAPVDPGLVTPVGNQPTSTPPGTSPPAMGTAGLPPEPALDVLEPDPCRTRRLCRAFPPQPFEVRYDREVDAGGTSTIRVTIDNPYYTNITRAEVGIETPVGWGSTTDRGTVADLAPGTSATLPWTVAVPESTPAGRYDVSLTIEWRVSNYSWPIPRNDSASVADRLFRLRTDYALLVRPSGCPDPCSLLASDPAGRDAFSPADLEIGSTTAVTGYLHNPYPGRVANVSIRLIPPDPTWNVTPTGGTNPGALQSGDSRPVSWNVTVPESAYCAREYSLRGNATYEQPDGERVTIPVSFSVPVRNEGSDCLLVR